MIKNLYKHNPEWKDVTPIYNDEDEDCVIKIAVTEEFVDAFGYFRALISVNEFSERALKLTETCAFLNAANYSVWQYRRDIIKAIGSCLEKEFDFCDKIILENPKNYQVWHHKKVLVELFNYTNYELELEFTTKMLQDDSKNYHAWQYRQWIVEHFDLFTKEDNNFSTICILEDLRNNSAWNYRYFISAHVSNGFDNKEILDREINFTLHCLKKIVNNESAWNYLSGILVQHGLNDNEKVTKFCSDLLSSNPPSKSTYLRNFVIDCLIEKLEKGEDVEINKNKAYKILNELEELDLIKAKYWQYRKKFIDNLINNF